MNIGKKTAGTLALPVLVLAACMLISMMQGVTLFDSSLSWITFVRAAANVVLVTYALSINLNSGRFDFSIGSVALLSSLIGAGIPVITFDLREPSLHEIFVEKVGEANEALED